MEGENQEGLVWFWYLQVAIQSYPNKDTVNISFEPNQLRPECKSRFVRSDPCDTYFLSGKSCVRLERCYRLSPPTNHKNGLAARRYKTHTKQ